MKCLVSLTDQQLVQLYVEGNTEALSTLVTRYKDKIYTSIYLLVKDKYLAEDLFQDVFIRIMTRSRAVVTPMRANSFPGPCVSRTICVSIISAK